MKKLPRQIFVTWEGDKGEEYLNAQDDPAAFAVINTTVKVAEYRLVGVCDVAATVKLSEPK